MILPIPAFAEFYDDYVDCFFNGTELNNGRGFIIMHDKEPVGFISYCSFHLKTNKSELDIRMNCEANCGKGFGTDAIISLADHLGSTMGIRKIIMRPSLKNARAIRYYKKAGLEEVAKAPGDYLLDEYISLYGEGDYGADETALLVKRVEMR